MLTYLTYLLTLLTYLLTLLTYLTYLPYLTRTFSWFSAQPGALLVTIDGSRLTVNG